MDFLNELFGSEMGELKRHQKTEEEIKKFSTSEDFTELKRAVHLLKKGYEIQKISVINHLDRYLLELGANDLLLQIIIDSMADWDYKMQIECANSFIAPINQKLIDQKNLQKIMKFAIEVLVSDEYADNEQLIEAWYQVFDVIVAQTDQQYTLRVIFPSFNDMPSLKNPLPKRKKGNRLLITFAKQIGEVGFDKEPAVLKLVQGICHDNNYKIRLDGVLFFKDYLLGEQKATIIAHPRFKNIYLSELLELLNDEESYIRIEALEILTEFLNQLTPEDIENEFVKEMLKTIEADNEEIQLRLAEIIGKIVFQLQPFNFHMKYKEPILEFYKMMVGHKEIKMRRQAVYNLPCFHSLYKNQDIQDEYDLDFNELYLRFAKEEDSQIQKTVAASIHEAFKISTVDEDTQKLRDAFKIVIENGSREIISVITENIDISLLSYANAHAVKTYAPQMGGFKEEVQQEAQHPMKKFLSIRPSKEEKKPLQKKFTALNLDKEEEPPQIQLLPYVMPENFKEIIYADLMSKLLIFDNNLQSAPGLWRNSIVYLKNLCKAVHNFNMPEFQESFLATLFEYIKAGNSEIRQAAANCISRILEYQYNTSMRLELISAIKSDLAESTSCVLRKTFLFFCKSAVETFSRHFFKTHFLSSYLNMSKDKVAAVRMEFAHSVVKLKPFLDYDQTLSNELMSLLTSMHSDPDPDVAEAVQASDDQLLQIKKKTREQEKLANQQDAEKQQFESGLSIREAREEEERKKRNTEEEETKFDFALLETNKKFKRGKMNPFTLNGRKAGGVGSVTTKPSNGVTGGMLSTSKGGQSSLLQAGSAIVGQSTLQVPTSGSSLHQINGDKTPQKKKPGSTTSIGAGTKKSEPSSVGMITGPSNSKGGGSTTTIGTGNVLGYSTGINQQNSSDKKSGSTLGVNSNDFAKRHSVLVTTSSQSLAGALSSSTNMMSQGSGQQTGATGSAAKSGTNKSHLQARKPSFMNSDA